jgi:hypothetical protein
VGRPEGKRPLERLRHRWEVGVRMDLRQIGLGGVEFVHLAQDKDWQWDLVNSMMELCVLAPWSYLVS